MMLVARTIQDHLPPAMVGVHPTSTNQVLEPGLQHDSTEVEPLGGDQVRRDGLLDVPLEGGSGGMPAPLHSGRALSVNQGPPLQTRSLPLLPVPCTPAFTTCTELMLCLNDQRRVFCLLAQRNLDHLKILDLSHSFEVPFTI